MATVVSTPSQGFQATLITLANGGVNRSANIYISVNNPSAWEVVIPVQVRLSNVSADPVVTIYRSADNGGTYDTTPFAGFSIARVASSNVQGSITLPTGQYLLQVNPAGPYSASVAVLTGALITSVINV